MESILPPVNQRIKSIIEKDFRGSVRAFCLKLGYKESQKVNRLFSVDPRNGKYPHPSIQILTDISNKLDNISLEWLQKGDISTINNGNDISTEEVIDNFRLVPLINMDAVGGMNTAPIVIGEPEHVIRMIAFTDANQEDICIQVSSNSMAPTCPAGSIVLIREVLGWREYFGYGNIFVLELKDGRRIIKEISRYIPDPQKYVLCVSHDPQIPSEELPKNLIVRVWKVIKILTNRGW